MMIPKELVRKGLSLRTIYSRAAALGLTKPYKFTGTDRKRIENYRKPKGGKR